jgi:LysM repeat protein
MAGTGTRRAPKPPTARRVVTVAGLGVAFPVVGAITASAADTYTVQKGDTLSGIAQHHGYGSDWHSLYDANKSTVGGDPNLILPGQHLALGAPKAATKAAAKPAADTHHATTYVVRSGDSLSKIAARYHVQGGWRHLYAENRSAVGADPAALRVGTRLRVDAGGSTVKPLSARPATTTAKTTVTAATQVSVPTTVAGIMAAARSIVPAGQFSCFSNIVQRESSWNPRATNPSSGAYGLVQALPGSKMASVGADWRTNPITQLKWGLGYMNSRYGSPCQAWSFWQAHNWY